MRKKYRKSKVEIVRSYPHVGITIVKCSGCGRPIVALDSTDPKCVKCNYGSLGGSVGRQKDLKELMSQNAGYRLTKGFNLLNYREQQ